MRFAKTLHILLSLAKLYKSGFIVSLFFISILNTLMEDSTKHTSCVISFCFRPS